MLRAGVEVWLSGRAHAKHAQSRALKIEKANK